MGAQGRRDELLEARSGQVRWRRGRAGTRLEALHNAGALALLLEPRRIYFGSGLGAEHDLARGGEILELEDARRTRTGDEQLAVRRLRRGRNGTRPSGRRRTSAARRSVELGLTDRLDRPLHVRRRPGGALGMALVVEEEEQRVPSKLEDVAAVPLGHRRSARRSRRRSAGRAPRRRPCPWRTGRSASAVKPEMSTDTREPSSVRARGASSSALQARTSRGT